MRDTLTARLHASRAFTLVEVLISMGILALMSAAIISSLTFSTRANRLNNNAMTAKNIAQSYIERMNVAEWTDINETNFPDVDYSSDPPVWLDQALGIKCKVDIEIKGVGDVSSATSTTLTDSSANWSPDEWQGDAVYIVDGRAMGYWDKVVSNTSDTLTLESGLSQTPDNTSKYRINNGKTIEVTTYWEYMGEEYSQTIESLVANYRSSSEPY